MLQRQQHVRETHSRPVRHFNYFVTCERIFEVDSGQRPDTFHTHHQPHCNVVTSYYPHQDTHNATSGHVCRVHRRAIRHSVRVVLLFSVVYYSHQVYLANERYRKGDGERSRGRSVLIPNYRETSALLRPKMSR